MQEIKRKRIITRLLGVQETEEKKRKKYEVAPGVGLTARGAQKCLVASVACAQRGPSGARRSPLP
jgi:hypothetical protein